MTATARPRYVKTYARTQRDLRLLMGMLIRHTLADGTRVLAVIDGERGNYCTARIVDGPHEGRIVRLGARTRRA